MRLRSLRKAENWWACWFGFLLFSLCFLGVISVVPEPTVWLLTPLDAFPGDMVLPFVTLMLGLMIIYSAGIKSMKGSVGKFPLAFLLLFFIGFLMRLIGKQVILRTYGLEYVLWALITGMLISNTVGIPKWLKPAVKTSLYIKTGLVLLGAEILFGRILNLGVQGLLLAWGVTPVVLVFMYWYGTTKLRVDKQLAIIIAAATSVCGVSAAIAVAAATRAKKEYLTLAISITCIATVVMLVGLPALIKTVGIDNIVGGAWMGGTIDSTGAVVAAGEFLGQEAMEVASVIKLIQNIMIGVIAFVVALLWVTRIDKQANDTKPSLVDIWYRFPKFVLGFLILSVITSFVLLPSIGEASVLNSLKLTKSLRSYFFSIAFLSIGLETNLREMKSHMGGGAPVRLYVTGQVLNVVLTLLFAWLLFGNVL